MSELDGQFTPAMDPNTEHQVWSHWTFRVWAVRNVPAAEVQRNAHRWLRVGFKGAVGRMKVSQTTSGWVIEAQVEGVPAQEDSYIQSARSAFEDFVEKGWGPLARGTVEVKVLSGEPPTGGSRSQLLAIPPVDISEELRMREQEQGRH